MDKRKSSKNGDALQLHIDRKKKMMESYFGEEEEIRSTVSLFIK